ncbi:unnamed protein product, partial [Effrenium voratum]
MPGGARGRARGHAAEGRSAAVHGYAAECGGEGRVSRHAGDSRPRRQHAATAAGVRIAACAVAGANGAATSLNPPLSQCLCAASKMLEESSTPGPRRMDVQVPGPGFQMAPPAAVRAAPGGDWRPRPGPMMQPGVQPSMHPGMQPLPMQPGMPGMQPQSGMQPGVPGMQPMPQVLLMPHARPLGPMVPVAMFGRPDA